MQTSEPLDQAHTVLAALQGDVDRLSQAVRLIETFAHRMGVPETMGNTEPDGDVLPGLLGVGQRLTHINRRLETVATKLGKIA